MSVVSPTLPDVYSLAEVARAAGADVRDVRALVGEGQVGEVSPGYLTAGSAVRAIRLLNAATGEAYRSRPLFHQPPAGARLHAMPFAASTALHAATVAAIILVTALGLRETVTEARVAREPMRLVFLAVPGPGGGGGGGGMRQPAPPARAQLKGRSALRSPVVTQPRPKRAEPKPEPTRPAPKPVEKPVDVPAAPAAPPVPPVEAPAAPAAQDPRDQAGVAEMAAPPSASQGPGQGGGSGNGVGTGMGDGRGSGIGDGEGGGTGGGPYRPGSGITPPGLLREVKPQYTEEARRRGIEGDVVLEIVVRSDGTVGQVTMLRSLGAGLDRRAVDAVRQWRFSPARRYGTPVDVLVEVAVEFKLR